MENIMDEHKFTGRSSDQRPPLKERWAQWKRRAPLYRRAAREWTRITPNFCKPRAPWPGRNLDQPLRFCAPEVLQNPSSTRPP